MIHKVRKHGTVNLLRSDKPKLIQEVSVGVRLITQMTGHTPACVKLTFQKKNIPADKHDTDGDGDTLLFQDFYQKIPKENIHPSLCDLMTFNSRTPSRTPT